MRPENTIEVHNITKRFKVYLDKGRTLKELALFSKRRRYEERDVLKGISFEVRKGEAIGLIGNNGCGKSTTLKLLTKIMYPDSGAIEMKGRVSSLIELGAGFHPDMSGRQNIYTNASIFGLTRKEIDRRLADIISFSELEEFIDNPVRTYSSGMYMRLAFSVAINVDADILLIDEILAVGDTNFQSKCFDKLREIKANGTTIVIVSHSLGQIEQICERTIWLHEGKIRAEGIPREIHPYYLDYMGKKRNDSGSEKDKNNMGDNKGFEPALADKKRVGDGRVRITEIKLTSLEGGEQQTFKVGEGMKIHVKYNVNSPIENAIFSFGIVRNDGLHCYGTNTVIDQVNNLNINNDSEFFISIPRLELMPGKYMMDFGIEADFGVPVDIYLSAINFEMFSDSSDVGILKIFHTWKC